MQLKSIEIIGFKSFADKTRINFPRGMTGIVGPNGSGKSNIAEAIRWVMGEQSAKNLRGTKMPDVIFSGSADRHSLGMASVILRLDNHDHYVDSPFDELLVARKLFRNGDSAYFINDKQCRLKDVNNLFMDTGIGQGSLSIISQGNVEEIINSKPIERRSIIENVAGVYKYKQHKLTAQKEIDETNDNLNRVEDILRELKRRLQPLEEQSSLATDYLDQKKRLDGLLKQQLIFKATQSAAEGAQLEESVSQKQAVVKSLTQRLTAAKQQRDSLQVKLTDGRKTVDDLNDRLLKAANQIQSLKSQHQLTTQEKGFKTAELNRLVDQLQTGQTRLADDRKKEAQLINEQENLAAKLKQNTTELSTITAKQKQTSVAVVEQKINDLRNQYVDLLQEQTTVKNLMTQKAHEDQQGAAQLAAQKKRVEEADNQVDILSAKYQGLTATVASSKAELEAAQQQLAALKQSHKHCQAIVDQTQADWLAALKIAEEAKAKANSLKQLHDSYRGFYRGVSNLLRHKDQLSGILGPVADYLKIDSKYVKAINTALGSQVQHVIVQDNQAASVAIDFLTRNRLGRVTLLPISTIEGRQLNPGLIQKAEGHQGYIGVAADLVVMPDQLTAIKRFLLGTTVIADRLANAIAISQAIHHRTRIVTLDGQVVNAGGSLTGGANRNDHQGVLIQKTELASLEKATKEMAQKLAVKEAALKTAKGKLEKFQASYDRGKQHVFELSQTYENQLVALNDLKDQLHQQNRVARTLKLALKNLTHNLQRTKQADLAAQSQSIQAELAAINRQLDDQQEQLTKARQLANRYSQAKQKVHDQLVIAKQQSVQVHKRLMEVQDQLKSHEASLAKLKKQRAQLLAELNQTMDVEKIAGQIKQVTATQADLRSQLKQAKQLVDRTEQQLAAANETVQTSQLNLRNAQFEQQTVATKLQQIRQALQVTYGQLNETYHLKPADLANQPLTVDATQLDRQIKLLRTGIDEIGPVNIGAIQEFKDVSSRYEFLSQQQQDLLKAKNHLTQTMAEMDQTISSQFDKTFRAIAKAFSKVFVDMFGGGEAKLVLTEPANPLTTGIEIMVKPPGKNYRSLSLLSGGEKALTAITLLFAIIKVRPVPFCILDEAEAALDPFNADRFAQYLKRFGNETQFIVITHRKETMIYADQLYGVTMQESGVSKVVGVNLDNLQTEVS
ncbi:chromosome partition protein Smc [Lentilactobacillus fungorum]|uniref:Chromosome partition protein Smc n=1 Tax=Lentilactobacillus fungorum TaxID=2201250 RepID=A0ABQ3VWE9_9LACO|nr:chromosome segregation protein SMC [Lentilactobacillus fungorum]GHP12840.1 chromosome partition protein Smc [Lentilactobacillus fungorum]